MQNLIVLKAHAESNARYSTLLDSYKRTAETPERREQLKSQVAGIENEIEAIKSQCQEISTSLTETDSMIFDKSRIAQSDGMCPYTKEVCSSIKSLAEHYKAETKSLKELRDAVASDLEDAKLKLSEKEDELRQMSTKLDQMYGAANQVEKLSAAIYQDALVADVSLYDAEIERSKKLIEELREKLSHIEANKRYEELTDKLTNDKYRIEQNIEILKAWIKLTDVNGIQSEIMKKPFISLADSITEKLKVLFDSESILSSFNLEEKANSFSFGIIRNGQYIEFDMLSSGEKCLYTLALTMSLVEMSGAKLKLLMVDDLLDHLDQRKIAAVFETLYKCTNIQIILAGVQQCNHLESDRFVISL
jgi:predicted  nucleic acid-binding Zn-ribbon protein